MRHVANGIIDLSLVERPPSPIREACALIKADRQIGVYKIGITDLFALAQRHCRDLGVEHGMGRLAREIMDNLDILSSGMKNLQHILIIGEQIKQRRKEIGRESCRERVCQYVSISVVAVSLQKKKNKKQY